MPWPITTADVVAQLGVTPSSATDQAWVERATGAAVRWVERHVPALELEDADRQAGAVLLAARLYARRNSPGGVVALGDMGAGYISRQDPDVSALLGLARPRVG